MHGLKILCGVRDFKKKVIFIVSFCGIGNVVVTQKLCSSLCLFVMLMNYCI